MINDRAILTLLAVLFVVCAIPAALYFRKLPVEGLTASEKELADFSSKPVPFTPTSPLVKFSGLVCPVRPAQKPVAHVIAKNAVKAPTPLPAPVSPNKASAPRTFVRLPVVSMISYDDSTKIAIIDSRVVNEGSKIDGGMVVKIEQNRVLIRKDGKDLWLTIAQ